MWVEGWMECQLINYLQSNFGKGQGKLEAGCQEDFTSAHWHLYQCVAVPLALWNFWHASSHQDLTEHCLEPS